VTRGEKSKYPGPGCASVALSGTFRHLHGFDTSAAIAVNLLLDAERNISFLTGRLKRHAHLWCKAFPLLLAPAMLSACTQENAFVAPPPPKVVVAKPLQKPAIQYNQATGNTAALNSVDLVARVQGYLEKINYPDGARVKQGTLLFEIQRNTYEAQLAQAKAALASAQATALINDINYQRYVTLGRQGGLAVTQKQIDDAKAALDSANASVENAKASVELATINLDYTRVAAPFDGIVSRHLADLGSLVGYSTPTTLATIVQTQPIYVYFTASESAVLGVRQQLAEVGRSPEDYHKVPVEIGLMTDTGYPISGHLDYVAPQVNTATGTLEIRGIFENKDGRLLPGLFVRVRVPQPKQRPGSALWVNETAIGQNQLGEYLLILGKDNVVEQRQIMTGRSEGGLKVVESGLSPNDQVITSGIQRAVPGQKVNPEERTMLTAAAGQ
jgi:multidrug efflux system membrane fusion protein